VEDEEIEALRLEALREQARLAQTRLRASGGVPSADPSVPASEKPKNDYWKLVKTLPDGGKLYEGKKGEFSYAGEGFATTNPDVIEKLVSGVRKEPETVAEFMAQDIVDRNVQGALAMKFLEYLPFVGTYADEALAASMEQMPGGTENVVREAQTTVGREKPAASVAAGGAGVAAGTVALWPLLVEFGAARGLGFGQKVVSGGLRGLGLGATEGAIAGFGKGETVDERLKLAGEFGTFGAATGGFLGGLGAPVEAGTQFIGRRLGFLQDIKPPGVPTPTPAAGQQAGAPTPGQPPGTPAPITPDEQAFDEAATEYIGGLLNQAARGGLGSDEAVERLARLADVNPEIVAAAERLGFQLPPDTFIDHTQLQRAIGITRSVQGSAAEASFLDSVQEAARRADEIIAGFDGTPDLSMTSERVRQSLTSTRDDLKSGAAKLYNVVNQSISPSVQANTDSLLATLTQRVKDLGGDPARLSAAERRLYQILKNKKKPVTFGLLQQEKNAIGQALRKQQTEYGSLEEATLKRLYGAMSADQLATAGRVGGDELRRTLRLATQTEAKARALENRIIKAFGSDVDGSIANRLRTAVTSGAKGDIAALNRTLDVIPENLRKEAVASAIASLSRSRAGEAFSFSQFQTLFSGLRSNSQVYARLMKELGPGANDVMTDLYKVASKVAQAQRAISQTGKSNQGMLQAMIAEGLVSQAFRTGGRSMVQAVGASLGASMGGPVGAAVGASVSQALIRSGPERDALLAVSEVLRSPNFQRLLAQAAQTGTPPKPLIRDVVVSPEFKKWSKLIRLNNPEEWLETTIFGLKGYQASTDQTDAPTELRYNPETDDFE